MKETTYGNTPACINLVKIIDELLIDNKLNNYKIRKIGATLQAFNKVLKELDKIDYDIATNLAQLYYTEYRKCTEMYNNGYPEVLVSHLQTVISTKYKVWLRNRKR